MGQGPGQPLCPSTAWAGPVARPPQASILRAARERPQKGGMWFQEVWAAARLEGELVCPSGLQAVSLPQFHPHPHPQAPRPSCQAWGPQLPSSQGPLLRSGAGPWACPHSLGGLGWAVEGVRAASLFPSEGLPPVHVLTLSLSLCFSFLICVCFSLPLSHSRCLSGSLSLCLSPS